VAGGGGGGGGSGNNDACPTLCGGQADQAFRSDASMNGQAGYNAGNGPSPVQDGGGSGGGGGGLLGGLANPSVFFVNEWTGRGGNMGSSGAANGFAVNSLSNTKLLRNAGENGYIKIVYGGGTITVNGTVDGGRKLVVDSSNGAVVMNGAIGAGSGSSALRSLDVTGTQGITLAGGSVITTGAQSYDGALTLDAHTTAMTSTVNGAVSFSGSIAQAAGRTGDLSISNGSGKVMVFGQVGSAGTALGALSIASTGSTLLGEAVYAASLSKTGSGATTVGGGTVQTSGAQSYGGSLKLAGNTTLSSTGSGDVTVAGAIANDVSSNLTVSAANGSILLRGNMAVGTNDYGPTPLGDVSLSASDRVELGTAAAPIRTDVRSLSISAGSAALHADTGSSFTCGATYQNSVGLCATSGISLDLAAASTLSGPVSGPTGLTKSGAGTLTADGHWRYTGHTTLTGGKVELTGSAIFGSATYDGANVFTGYKYAGNLSIGSVATPDTQLKLSNSASQDFTGTVSGPGFITSPGSGALRITTLANADSYNLVPVYIGLASNTSLYGQLAADSLDYQLFSDAGLTNPFSAATATGTVSLVGGPGATAAAGNYGGSYSYTSQLSFSSERYYGVGGTSSAGWTVLPRPLQLSRVYDGSADFTLGLFTVSGLVNGDALPTLGGSATVSSKNAGSYTSFISNTLTSSDPNYTLSGAGVTATITKKELTVSGLSANAKVYDGSTAATLTAGGASASGVLGGDVVSLDGYTAAFGDKHVGTAKTVTVTGLVLGGADAGNYTLASSQGTLTADITPRSITAITGLGANSRAYDGSTTTTLDSSAAVFTGKVAGDLLSVAGGSASFADKHIGVGKAVSISGLTLGGADSGNYQLLSSVASASANITPAIIMLNVPVLGKTYDGTTDATLDTANAGFAGRIGSEALSVVGGSASFASKNAGNRQATVSGYSLGGADAANYVLGNSSNTSNATISPKAITAVTGITGVSRVYNTATWAGLDITAAALTGKLAGDNLSVTGASGVFANKHAGTGKTVTISDIVLGGTDAGNYTTSGLTATTTANITPASITSISGITAASKVYDALTGAVLNSGGAVFNGRLGSDVLTVASATGNFNNKNIGNGKAVAITGLTLGGADAGNYTLASTTASTSANITPASISAIVFGTQDKVYDGGTTATLGSAQFTGIQGSDQLSVASYTASFLDKQVGSGKTVNVSSLTLGGTDAGNYLLASSTATSSASITPKAITAVTGITAQDKVYDGSTAAALNTAAAAFTGLVAGDGLGVATATGNFTDKRAASGKTVAITGLSLNGADAGNYTLSNTTASTTASIAQADIARITGITALDKAYDGNTAATLNTAAAGFTGMVAGDALNVASATGRFADKHAATGKAVAITGLSLGGADAGNYRLIDATASTSAAIGKAGITAITGITAADKVYDGNTTATLNTTAAAFTGLVAGDLLTVAGATGRFADKHAASGKTVAITGLSLTGADAGNYTLLDTTASATASITPASITRITGITAADKVYDGNTAATLNTAAAGFIGLVAGDTLTVASATGSFADKHAARDKTVAITGLSLAGADAGNYTLLDTTAITTASITPASIARITGITAADKVYDGNTSASLSTGAAGFIGMVAGDTLAVAGATGRFADKHAARDKTVAITGLSLTGADAGNYTLLDTTASAAASITPAGITRIGGITAADKVYDGGTAATLNTAAAGFIGLVAGDTLAVASATGSFSDKHAATGKAVAITGLSLGGADAGNYTLLDTTATAQAAITPAAITAIDGIVVLKKTADGGTDAELELGAARLQGLLPGDALLLAQAQGRFDSALPGKDKPVSISDLVLGGADAGNYRIAPDATVPARGDIEAAVQPPPPIVLPATTPRSSGVQVTLPAPPAAVAALPLQALAQSVGGGITVTLHQPAAGGGAAPAATVAVTVPRDIASQAQGFNFPLPEAVSQRIADSGQPLRVTGADGEPLPGWLRYDESQRRFVARAVPSGGLPFQALLSFGDERVLVVVAEADH
ncbi:MAG TPA: YDG domain-containing protein, partial [Roseateles sp.]